MGSHWWEFLQALDAIEARSELFVMVIMLFQFILAHNCVGGRFPLVVITLVLNGTKFSWAGFFPPDLNLCFGGTIPSIPRAAQWIGLWRDTAPALSHLPMSHALPQSHVPACPHCLPGTRETSGLVASPILCTWPFLLAHEDEDSELC